MNKISRRYYGFEFNGKHTTDFGLMCVDKTVGFPTKNKVLINVPYSNHLVDLSGVYGGQTYSERPLSFSFIFYTDNNQVREGLYQNWTKVINWLSTPGVKIPLYDDVMHDYYYLAELVSAPSYEEVDIEGTITLEFTCYPFRIYELSEGNDIWDTFDFEMDIAQTVDYNVSDTRPITLYNIGVSTIMPSVKTTAPITISDGVKQYPLTKGTHDTVFNLPPGATKLTLTGNATVTFDWHKELIYQVYF